MLPKICLPLVFGILLNLIHLSSCESWEYFQMRHITSNSTVDCSVVDSPLFYDHLGRCKTMNTFIQAKRTRRLKNLCKPYPHPDGCFLTTERKFKVITCLLPRKPNLHRPCEYTQEDLTRSEICVLCKNGEPVHLERLGKCPQQGVELCAE